MRNIEASGGAHVAARSLTTWDMEALRYTLVPGSSLRNGHMSGAKGILLV